MSSKHLQTGDARPVFDNAKKFRIYSMKFCPFAQVCMKILGTVHFSHLPNVSMHTNQYELIFILKKSIFQNISCSAV